MKGLFLAAMTAATVFGFVSTASAAYCDLAACASTVTSDSGTAKTCLNIGNSSCICGAKAGSLGYCKSMIASSNGGSVCYVNIGAAIGTNLYCWGFKTTPDCVRGCTPLNGETQTEAEEIKETGDSQDIAKAFNPDQVNNYWGYVGSTLRSPAGGRTVAAIAKLDVCIGDGDVTAAIATNNATTCYNQYCGVSYNEYCNNNSAAVCQDRCECAINGVNHASCQSL
jgi:hypothetical protein